MTRTELNRIALETVQQFLDYKKDMHLCHATDFAHALLVEIQKKLEAVGYIDPMYGIVVRTCRPELSVKLTTLPIIEE